MVYLDAPGPDWRTTGAVAALAESEFRGGELPIVEMAGELLTYPQAMKRAKGVRNEKRPEVRELQVV